MTVPYCILPIADCRMTRQSWCPEGGFKQYVLPFIVILYGYTLLHTAYCLLLLISFMGDDNMMNGALLDNLWAMTRRCLGHG